VVNDDVDAIVQVRLVYLDHQVVPVHLVHQEFLVVRAHEVVVQLRRFPEQLVLQEVLDNRGVTDNGEAPDQWVRQRICLLFCLSVCTYCTYVCLSVNWSVASSAALSCSIANTAASMVDDPAASAAHSGQVDISILCCLHIDTPRSFVTEMTRTGC